MKPIVLSSLLYLLSLKLGLRLNLSNRGGHWQGWLWDIHPMQSYRALCIQGPALGLILCSHHPEYLLFLTWGSAFQFSLGPTNYVAGPGPQHLFFCSSFIFGFIFTILPICLMHPNFIFYIFLCLFLIVLCAFCELSHLSLVNRQTMDK